LARQEKIRRWIQKNKLKYKTRNIIKFFLKFTSIYGLHEQE